MERLLINDVKIFLENKIIDGGAVWIENGQIKAIEEKPVDNIGSDVQVIDGKALNLIPGFIDAHIHGANGADTMDATEKAIDDMAILLPKEGTTSFLATTITQSPETIERALENVARYNNKPGHAEVVGVHLEGPYVNKVKAGAQPVQYITEPDLEQFNQWQKISGNQIRTITMAPELDQEGIFIRALNEQGINVSAGHTDASFAGIKKAVQQGVQQLTHLCNAMNGIHHRDIGAVGAAFQLESVNAELIPDGIHVSPDMMELIYRNVGSERLILITDAMRAKGLPAGDYELGGQPVKVTEDRAVLEDGTLAGSIVTMRDGAANMLAIEGVTLVDIVKMASSNPAKQVGVFDRKGSIDIGKDADLLLVDDQLKIKYTICRGEMAFKGE
ncbi:N-acetylglucosamine-6-phosphate deacetylase [Robertmurraya massiliosenegalensis]|uniref:N-acetylglucosamine-6-phosphate deacetylase n=1 Tax=Robertmurraya massiliosenegalensis TaxID=1287657 RepID=UPI000301621C|nr:N-acetylglucosamine-6-phosphate deacetylase [Robertmurraya massiliosenegalensis]